MTGWTRITQPPQWALKHMRISNRGTTSISIVRGNHYKYKGVFYLGNHQGGSSWKYYKKKLT